MPPRQLGQKSEIKQTKESYCADTSPVRKKPNAPLQGLGNTVLTVEAHHDTRNINGDEEQASRASNK